MQYKDFWLREGVLPIFQHVSMNEAPQGATKGDETLGGLIQESRNPASASSESHIYALWRGAVCLGSVVHSGEPQDRLFLALCSALHVIPKTLESAQIGELLWAMGASSENIGMPPTCQLESIAFYKQNPEKKAQLWQAFKPIWPSLTES